MVRENESQRKLNHTVEVKKGLNCMKKCDTEETKSYSRRKKGLNCMRKMSHRGN